MASNLELHVLTIRIHLRAVQDPYARSGGTPWHSPQGVVPAAGVAFCGTPLIYFCRTEIRHEVSHGSEIKTASVRMNTEQLELTFCTSSTGVYMFSCILACELSSVERQDATQSGFGFPRPHKQLLGLLGSGMKQFTSGSLEATIITGTEEG